MGALWVLAVLCVVALVFWAFSMPVKAILAKMEAQRHMSNVRVCIIHRHAGNKWYPHEMADGSVRWYRTTDDDAVDI